MLLANPNAMIIIPTAIKSASTFSFWSVIYKHKWIWMNIFWVWAPIQVRYARQRGLGQGTFQNRCTHICSRMRNYLKKKKKSVWLNHGWTFRKRRRSTGHTGWPCTSRSAAAAGGGQRAELQHQGDAANRVYLLGEGRNWFWQLFLGGSYWENTWSFAELSQLSELHKSAGCDCCLVAQKNERYLATDRVLPQQKHSNVVWYDTLHL